MSSNPPFFYDPLGVGIAGPLCEDETDVAPVTDFLDLNLAPNFQPLDATSTLGFPPSRRPSSLSGPSSSSSPRLPGTSRRRQSSSFTALSPRSLESDSSRGPSGTPESRQSGKNKSPDNGWPTLRPQPSKTDSGSSSGYNPINKPVVMPPKRSRRATKPKPEPSKEVREARKARDLSRNRKAAEECRKRKKKAADELEDSRLKLEEENSHLKMERDALIDEATRTKAVLLGHSDCQDPNIYQWLENEAKRYVMEEDDRFNKIMANLGPTPGLPYQHGHDDAALLAGPSSYPGSTQLHASPSPPAQVSAVYQQDTGYLHSPGLYGEDQDPSYMAEMQASQIAVPDFALNPLQGQYADYPTEHDYVSMPNGSYQ